jgi:rhomboid protease GluP
MKLTSTQDNAADTGEHRLHENEFDAFSERLDHLSPNAPVTPVLVGLNILVFIVMVFNGAGILAPNAEVAIAWGSNFGPLTLDGQWWRLLSSTFIHFGIFHIALNMLALYQTGCMVERMYGSRRFLALYVFAGLTGSMASLLWNPVVNSAGASGAIFGVFGGLFVFMLNPKNGVPRSIMNAHRNSTLIFIAYNIFNGLAQSGIDNGAHFGGLLGGMFMGHLLARPITESSRFTVNRQQLMTAGIAGLLALGLMSFRLVFPSFNTQQELIFNRALTAYATQEQKAVIDTNRLFANDKVVTAERAAAVANTLEKSILPQWENLYQLVGQAKLSRASRQFKLQQLLLAYLDDRRNSCKLMIEGIRKNDSGLIFQAGLLLRDSAKQLAAMRKLSSQ